MRAHAKSGKTCLMAWRPFSFAVVLFLLLAGFSPAATGQNAEIGRPSLVSPIHKKTEIVAYTRGRPGYGIRIYAKGTAGTNKVGEGRVSPWGWGWVIVNRPLEEGETITAVQVDHKTNSEGFPSLGKIVERVPSDHLIGNEKLKAPTIVPTPFDCQGGFWVKDLVEGVKIPYEIAGPKSQSGHIWTPYQDGFILLQSGLVETQRVKAWQELPPFGKSPAPATQTVGSRPASLASLSKPQIVDLTVGSKVLGIGNLIIGAKVDIYEGLARDRHIGGGIAQASGQLFSVEPFTTPDVWAEQSLCEGERKTVSPRSDPVPLKSLAPPGIEQPICDGATSVTALGTKAGADVELQVKESGDPDFQPEGGAGASGGTTVINFRDGLATLAAGDKVRVRQSQPPPPPNPSSAWTEADVVGTSTPRFEIGNGTPCKACQGYEPGPRFVVGDSIVFAGNKVASTVLTHKSGPIFKATMCGAKSGAESGATVQILRPGNVSVANITLKEVEGKKGYFEGRWKNTFIRDELGPYIARFRIDGAMEDGHFYVTTQGCLDCAVMDFYRACVERMNSLRKRENLTPLTQDKIREGCSDYDALTNHKTNTPHYSMCGSAQNECGPYSLTKDILDECIERKMYYDEKLCFDKYQRDHNDPTVCYSSKDKPGCNCQYGHYVNMTDKARTKAACGIYVTPTGQYKALMNFW